MNSASTPDGSRGLLASVSRLGVTMLSLAENKCALFANEWETERIWQMRIALRMVIAVLALTLASLFAAGSLVLLLWDWSPSLAVLAPCAIFAVIGAVLWRSATVLRAAKPPAFNMTRNELQKDCAVFGAFGGAKND